MPHTRGVDGRTLVPDISQGLNLLVKTFGTKQSRAKDEEERQRRGEVQEQIDIIAGGVEGDGITGGEASRGQVAGRQKKIEAALLRLSGLNPQVAAGARQVLERGDRLELLQARQETEKGVRDALTIKRAKTPQDRIKALRRMAHEKAALGEDVNRLIELSNLEPAQLELELDKMIIQGADLKTLVDDALRPAQETFAPVMGEGGTVIGQQSSVSGRVFPDPRASEGVIRETFETLTDEQGNVTGQRSLLTGKVIADPRTPKQPTKTSLIKNLEAIGIDPNTPEGRELVKKSITKPGVKIDLNEGIPFKIPPGFILLDPKDPAKGVTPLPGGPKDTLSGENAAKASMLKTARTAAKGVRGLIFEEDGSLNTINLFNAQFNTPFTEGRKLRNKMEFGIQAITRNETGAAMPENEVENTRTRFMPTIGDTPEIANTKLKMFDEFIGGTLKLLDPSGRFNAERFSTELQNRVTGEGPVQSPVSEQTDEQLLGGF